MTPTSKVRESSQSSSKRTLAAHVGRRAGKIKLGSVQLKKMRFLLLLVSWPSLHAVYSRIHTTLKPTLTLATNLFLVDAATLDDSDSVFAKMHTHVPRLVYN